MVVGVVLRSGWCCRLALALVVEGLARLGLPEVAGVPDLEPFQIRCTPSYHARTARSPRYRHVRTARPATSSGTTEERSPIIYRTHKPQAGPDGHRNRQGPTKCTSGPQLRHACGKAAPEMGSQLCHGTVSLPGPVLPSPCSSASRMLHSTCMCARCTGVRSCTPAHGVSRSGGVA